jgi:hypothetical protein
MAETSAHLTDHVLPEIPIRQWALSFPWALRLLYSTRAETLSRTLGIVNRALRIIFDSQGGSDPQARCTQRRHHIHPAIRRGRNGSQ